MDLKNIHKDAEWYASYMSDNDKQGKALVLCQAKKIKQLTELIEVINGDIELFESPRECNAEDVLHSIKSLIESVKKVEVTCGSFKWVG